MLDNFSNITNEIENIKELINQIDNRLKQLEGESNESLEVNEELEGE